MKISELVRRTKAPKETIHYYIRAGLLPKPRKLGSNSADYDQSYVERIRLIKELQNDFFFPLPAIKKIMWEHRSASKLELLKLRSEYFRPLEQYLGAGLKGDRAFMEATGIGPEWLERLRRWGIISARREGGQGVFSQDDVIIAKVIMDMHRLGFNDRERFDPRVIRDSAQRFREIVRLNKENFLQATAEAPDEERRDLAAKGLEIMGVFFYHLFRKFGAEPEAEPRDQAAGEGADAARAR